MNISCGIVGLPNAGKSTLFNALLQKQQALAANYPFATIEPNVGIVPVADDRLKVLAGIVGTQNIIPSTIKFYDIAGLVKGAHEGEGLGNKFLSHIREVDLVVHVIRHFNDSNVVQAGSGNPQDDLDTIQTELILADLQTIDNQREPKGRVTPEEKTFWEITQKIKKGLEEGRGVNELEWTQKERETFKPLFLLTAKPAMYVLNVSEEDVGDISKIESSFGKQPAIAICAKLESELIDFSIDEKDEYLQSNNLDQTGLDKLVSTAFKNLGLISFLTAGEKEVRSWTIPAGIKAPQAAGVIHSDFETNFIKAVACSYEHFAKENGWQGAKEKGLVRTEGRDYIVKADDVIEFMVGN